MTKTSPARRSACGRGRAARVVGTAATALLATAIAVSPAQAINGGEEVSKPYSFMASIQSKQNSGQICGGSLIAPTWVLTARHCMFDRDGKPVGTHDKQVRIGSLDRTRGGEVRNIAQVVSPPDGGAGDLGTDLALLRLDAPVEATPVDLPEKRPRVGTGVRILGWGDHELPQKPGDPFPDPPTMLRRLDSSVVTSQRCNGPDGKYITDKEFCVATTPAGESARAGDSGGPVLVKGNCGWTLGGVVSRTGWFFDGREMPDGIDVSVADHLDWIRNTLPGPRR
ncbi:serine protease (plasmid) [Embleya sp. NBC_00888]|uniref:S1 family peptidase n=1 Tax=Embleya sp. NBC_00888 TaxID=2975960 RepID=UPI002F9097B6|nr:serine protease [Embleya sp. NBC_00888]